MLKQYIIKALIRLKDNQAIHRQFYDLGLDATAYFDKTGYISLIEEAIATMLSNGDEKKFEAVLYEVQWWLYENVDHVYFYDDKPNVDVNKTEDFVNWLFDQYEVKN